MKKWNLGVIGEYLGITAGCLITAFSLILFTVPNKIAAGGVSGLATIVFYVVRLPVGLTMLAINIPLFLLSLKELGVRFGLRTLYGTIVLSLMVDILDPLMGVPTRDPLLAAIYGGITGGLGLGIVFRFRGTTGGTDLAAQLFKKYARVSVGQALLAIDAVVIALAGIVFNMELALYAMITLFITARVIDLVQEGMGYAKAAFVISKKPAEIAHGILHQLNRGATALSGRGLYTGQSRDVLLCVVSRAEISKLKALVSTLDPEAFVIITNVHEALGEGFREFTEEQLTWKERWR